MIKKPEISAIELAYLAGIIDGEGHIGIAGSKKPSNRIDWVLRLSISNTSEELMDWLDETFGHIVTTKYKRLHRRAHVMVWRTSGRQTQEILRLVLPYLRIKREQAELALSMNIGPYGGGCRWSITNEERDSRIEIYRQMRELNSKDGSKGQYERLTSIAEEVAYS